MISKIANLNLCHGSTRKYTESFLWVFVKFCGEKFCNFQNFLRCGAYSQSLKFWQFLKFRQWGEGKGWGI